MNFFLMIIKRIILSICLIYGINLVVYSFNYVIPINEITIALVMLLGIPGVIGIFLLNQFK